MKDESLQDDTLIKRRTTKDTITSEGLRGRPRPEETNGKDTKLKGTGFRDQGNHPWGDPIHPPSIKRTIVLNVY